LALNTREYGRPLANNFTVLYENTTVQQRISRKHAAEAPRAVIIDSQVYHV